MRLLVNPFQRFTFLSAAAYLLMFAVCAKGVYLYESRHPPREELLHVKGVVKDVRLGGHGKATSLQIESDHGMHRYSSYYGKVWPGMESIEREDVLDLLAEHNTLNRNEFIAGKQYYIWELIHDDRVLIRYEDIRDMVDGKEATINRYINLWLAISSVLFLVAYVRHIGETSVELN